MSVNHGSEASLEQRILALVAEIAPDSQDAPIDPAVPLREQIDFDSMDMLHFATALHGTFGIDIPERDYRQIGSIARCAVYLRSKGVR